jgi:hypothetical protein
MPVAVLGQPGDAKTLAQHPEYFCAECKKIAEQNGWRNPRDLYSDEERDRMYSEHTAAVIGRYRGWSHEDPRYGEPTAEELLQQGVQQQEQLEQLRWELEKNRKTINQWGAAGALAFIFHNMNRPN